MDIATLTLSGLAAIGVVNVITFFYPNLDSKIKFVMSFLAAFLILYIPPELGLDILNKAKEALVAAFAASGGYKLVQKAGGK